MFFVLFGMMAVNITIALSKEEVELSAFLRGACFYLLAGFLWSPVAAIVFIAAISYFGFFLYDLYKMIGGSGDQKPDRGAKGKVIEAA